MDIEEKLKTLCFDINTSKIRQRKETCIALKNYLQEQQTLEWIKINPYLWEYILNSILTAMEKDAEKIETDCMKNNQIFTKTSTRSGDLLVFYINLIDIHKIEISFHEFFDVLKRPTIVTCYEDVFLQIIQKNIVENVHFRKSFTPDDWTNLYVFVKTSFNRNTSLNTNQIDCLTLIIKSGVCFSSSSEQFTEIYNQIKQIFDLVNTSSPIPLITSVLNLINEFYLQTAFDNRIACCKLGEEYLPKILEMYEVFKSSESDINLSFIKFLKFQMILHHPKNVNSTNSAFYAENPTNWLGFVRNLYKILISEVKTTQILSRHYLFYTKNNIRHYQPEFIELFIRVQWQICFESDWEMDEPYLKRQKLENTFNTILFYAKSSKSWTWISLIAAMLKNYPDVITKIDINDFLVFLLELLENPNNRTNSRLKHHIYKVLNVLKSVENVGNEDLWMKIAQILAGFTSLYKNDEQFYKLLNKLLIYLVKPESVLQSPVVTYLTKTNLETIRLVFEQNTLLQNDSSFKQDIILWILKNSNMGMFHLKQTAEILVNLVLKKWHKSQQTTQKIFVKNNMDENIEFIYHLTNLEELILDNNEIINKDNNIIMDLERIIYVDTDLMNFLKEALINFVRLSDFEITLNSSILLMNILNFMIDFGIIEESNFATNNLCQFFIKILTSTFDYISQKTNFDSLQKQLNIHEKLLELFKQDNNRFISNKIIELIKKEFIQFYFEILHTEFKDNNRMEQKTKSVIFLINYSLAGEVNTELQRFTWTNLVENTFDFKKDTDFEMIICLIKGVIDYKPKILPKEKIESILGLFKQIFDHYQSSINVKIILELLSDLIPYVFLNNSEKLKEEIVFFVVNCSRFVGNHQNNIKPFLKCIGILYKVNPSCDLIFKFPDYLYHNSVLIRFITIRELAKFYKICSNIQILEEMYKKIEFSIAKLFENYNNLTVDDISTRPATILHIYATIIINSNFRTSQAFYTLIQNENIQLEMTEKIINNIAKQLKFPSKHEFLIEYTKSLFNQWNFNDTKTFPYKLFDCCTKIEFYTKYWCLLAPLIVKNDRNLLKEICNETKNIAEFIKIATPLLITYCIAENNVDFKQSEIFILLLKSLGEENLIEIIQFEIFEVMFCLLGFITNEMDFIKQFNVKIIFPKLDYFNLNVEQFKYCLNLLEEFAFKNENVMNYLLNKNPSKIHVMFLEIITKINRTQKLEQKFLYFYHYTILYEILLDSLIENQFYAEFFIKNLIYTLLHLIKDENQEKMQLLACYYLKNILDLLLNNFTDIIRKFFVIIVSPLKKLSKETSQLSQKCWEIFDILFITHRKSLFNEIQQLNSIPEKYQKLFDESNKNLLNKITHFNDYMEQIENINECEDDLIDLTNSLRNYTELNELLNIPHSEISRLMCILLNLINSTNSKMSKQVLTCIGTIGSCNFHKIILKPEQSIPDGNLTPIELLSNFVFVELVKYLIDSNIEIIKLCTKSLRKLFEFKEARKIAEKETDFGFGSVSLSYVKLYFTKTNKKFIIKPNLDYFMENVTKQELWLPKTDYNQWICGIIQILLQVFNGNEFITSLIDITSIKVEFSEKLLPLLIFTLLSCNNKEISQIFSEKISKIFDMHWNGELINKSILKTLLNIVDFVRLQENDRIKKLKYNLSIDYLRAAKVAQFCNWHLTTILYCELWCQTKGSKLDTILEELIDETTANIIQEMLRKSYKILGEMDALGGCGTYYLADYKNRMEHFKDRNEWETVIHDYQIQAVDNKNFLPPLVDSLQKYDLLEMPFFINNGEFIEDSQNTECLWRLGQWDYQIKTITSNNNSDFNLYKFQSMKYLYENDEFHFWETIQQFSNCLIDTIRQITYCTTTQFYNILTEIQSLKELEEFAIGKMDKITTLWNWNQNYNDYQYIEPIKAQRFTILTKLIDTNLYKEQIVNFLLDFVQYSRNENDTIRSSRILYHLDHIENLSEDIRIKIKMEYAQNHWIDNDSKATKSILKELCSNNINEKFRAIALKLNGEYLAEVCLENRTNIINKYYLESIEMLKKNNDNNNQILFDAYDKLAKFVDNEYQQVIEYIKSDVYQWRKEYVEKTKLTIKTTSENRPTEGNHFIVEEIDIKRTEEDKNYLLELALKYYSLALRHSDKYNVSIYRLLSLLLENKQNPIVESVLTTKIPKIPIYKFISILPQLMPHIYSPDCNIISDGICKIIEKCAKQHPHHTLPYILSLAYANKDQQYTKTTKKIENEERIYNAQKLLNKLKKDNIKNSLYGIIINMEILNDALIELAYASLNTKKIPKTLKITKIKHFDNVLLPTCHLQIQNDNQYNNIIGICNYDNCFENVGGINAPKKIQCLGTDGLKRTQLIKGRDDLRQDAVMQQVFININKIFNLEKQSKHLRIRTYKIVPLSMRSGIVEWVESSITIGEYLTGDGKQNKGAHVIYRPQDRTPNQSLDDFKKIVFYPLQRKLEEYKKICNRIQPVFHNFFQSQFPQASDFYEKRLNYIRSVATSSMCGYVLGIGDRHLYNILIDKCTAEVIHIDFGIAFEQGKILRHPETIPFRLTRDIVDGMGVSGTDGVFRQTCEKTLKVLKLHENTILTILEVLLYDPLYHWIVSLTEASRRNRFDEEDINDFFNTDSDTDTTENITAERALLRAKLKIQGREFGNIVNVQYQVNALIQQAKDVKNLCKLFHGWQPYL